MIDAVIDKLTNSVEEVATGRSYDTQITRAKLRDVRSLTGDWRFDWKAELKAHEVYRLTIPHFGPEIEGLISWMRRPGFVQVMLIENHPRNIGRQKKFAGVAGNLMASAAKLSIDLGNEGYIAFDAKTELFEHYQRTLGARRVGRSQRMVILPDVAKELIARYFGENHGPNA